MKTKQLKEDLSKMVDILLLERLPDLVSDELKWIRKEYGDDEISEFLCGDDYYSESILLNKIKELLNEFESIKNQTL